MACGFVAPFSGVKNSPPAGNMPTMDPVKINSGPKHPADNLLEVYLIPENRHLEISQL
jgi:hypothetical protein